MSSFFSELSSSEENGFGGMRVNNRCITQLFSSRMSSLGKTGMDVADWFSFRVERCRNESYNFVVVYQSLSHCELITDEGIRHVGMSPCAAEHLAVLELDNCPLITDAALDNLISCHSLQRIELYDCQLITRAGIRRLRVCAMSKED